MNRAGLVTNEPASATVRNWSKAQADFKQPRFDIHMLRHVYASLQIARGVGPERFQELMGHSTLRLTMETYSHLWPELEDDDRAAQVESAADMKGRALPCEGSHKLCETAKNHSEFAFSTDFPRPPATASDPRQT